MSNSARIRALEEAVEALRRQPRNRPSFDDSVLGDDPYKGSDSLTGDEADSCLGWVSTG